MPQLPTAENLDDTPDDWATRNNIPTVATDTELRAHIIGEPGDDPWEIEGLRNHIDQNGIRINGTTVQRPTTVAQPTIGGVTGIEPRAITAPRAFEMGYGQEGAMLGNVGEARTIRDRLNRGPANIPRGVTHDVGDLVQDGNQTFINTGHRGNAEWEHVQRPDVDAPNNVRTTVFNQEGIGQAIGQTSEWEEVSEDDFTRTRGNLDRQIHEPRSWSGRYGLIEICTMPLNHVKNCLARCKRDSWRMQFIPKFEEEIRLREPIYQEYLKYKRNQVRQSRLRSEELNRIVERTSARANAEFEREIHQLQQNDLRGYR